MANPSAEDRARRSRDTTQAVARGGRHGVITRAEWAALGWTDRAVAVQVARGAWTRPVPGIAVVNTMADPWGTRVRVAWLAGGDGAVIGAAAAARLLGIIEEAPRVIEVQVPHGRTPAKRSGVRFRHVRRVRDSRPWDGLRVTTPEETVLDLVSSASSTAEAARWIEAACGRRLTTPQLLLEALSVRARMKHRAVVVGACARVTEGEHSWLERRFTSHVVRAHGLPEPARQRRHQLDGRVTYADAEFDPYDVLVELDGRLGHDSPEGRLRDLRRDNAHVVAGRAPLRYGYPDVVGRPCAVAAQLGAVLQGAGWTGLLRRCGPACTLA